MISYGKKVYCHWNMSRTFLWAKVGLFKKLFFCGIFPAVRYRWPLESWAVVNCPPALIKRTVNSFSASLRYLPFLAHYHCGAFGGKFVSRKPLIDVIIAFVCTVQYSTVLYCLLLFMVLALLRLNYGIQVVFQVSFASFSRIGYETISQNTWIYKSFETHSNFC